MRQIPFSILALTFLSISVNAQIDSPKVETRFRQLEQQFQQLEKISFENQGKLDDLSNEYNTLQRTLSGLSNNNKVLSARLDSLNDILLQNRNALNGITQQLIEQRTELTGQISETRATTKENVSQLDEALNKNTLYWIIAVLTVGLFSLLAFFLLRKKVTANQSTITENLAKTRRELEQEAIRLDEKLVGIMETQMKLSQEERERKPEHQNGELYHSLALKVADEIVRIERNISQMDEGTKGLKQLAKAVERIRDNFAANGYEMVDMLDRAYDDGMKVTANFRPDESLKSGERIITRIIKPQVNYKGVMIQSAHVEVSQGE